MTECTVHQAAEAFIGYLRESGKKERTLYTYRKDLDVVESFFGADRQLAEIRLPQVGKFYKSDLLFKLPDGKERAERTVAKTVRVFRMMMVWAQGVWAHRGAAAAQEHAHGPQPGEGVQR
jgi:site-specific recombinase XerD